MLVDAQRKRILMSDGTSLLSDEMFVKNMLLGNDVSGMKVLDSVESRLYETFYGECISSDGEELPLAGVNHQHSDSEFNELLDALTDSHRFDPDNPAHIERIYREVEFFSKTQNVKFLLAVKKTIAQFKENGVVWGVGRGSACASFVLYLLDIHDVNPLEYDIPFSELSKEQDNDE